MQDSAEPKSPISPFAGLVNHYQNGASLNCLVQILFHTPQFRKAVFETNYVDDNSDLSSTSSFLSTLKQALQEVFFRLGTAKSVPHSEESTQKRLVKEVQSISPVVQALSSSHPSTTDTGTSSSKHQQENPLLKVEGDKLIIIADATDGNDHDHPCFLMKHLLPRIFETVSSSSSTTATLSMNQLVLPLSLPQQQGRKLSSVEEALDEEAFVISSTKKNPPSFLFFHLDRFPTGNCKNKKTKPMQCSSNDDDDDNFANGHDANATDEQDEEDPFLMSTSFVNNKNIKKNNSRFQFLKTLDLARYMNNNNNNNCTINDDVKYELCAVVLHSGNRSHGHFKCRVRDFSLSTNNNDNDKTVDPVHWHTFDDQTVGSAVTNFDDEQSTTALFGNGMSCENATMLAYIRKSDIISIPSSSSSSSIINDKNDGSEENFILPKEIVESFKGKFEQKDESPSLNKGEKNSSKLVDITLFDDDDISECVRRSQTQLLENLEEVLFPARDDDDNDQQPSTSSQCESKKNSKTGKLTFRVNKEEGLLSEIHTTAATVLGLKDDEFLLHCIVASKSQFLEESSKRIQWIPLVDPAHPSSSISSSSEAGVSSSPSSSTTTTTTLHQALESFSGRKSSVLVASSVTKEPFSPAKLFLYVERKKAQPLMAPLSNVALLPTTKYLPSSDMKGVLGIVYPSNNNKEVKTENDEDSKKQETEKIKKADDEDDDEKDAEDKKKEEKEKEDNKETKTKQEQETVDNSDAAAKKEEPKVENNTEEDKKEDETKAVEKEEPTKPNPVCVSLVKGKDTSRGDLYHHHPFCCSTFESPFAFSDNDVLEPTLEIVLDKPYPIESISFRCPFPSTHRQMYAVTRYDVEVSLYHDDENENENDDVKAQKNENDTSNENDDDKNDVSKTTKPVHSYVVHHKVNDHTVLNSDTIFSIPSQTAIDDDEENKKKKTEEEQKKTSADDESTSNNNNINRTPGPVLANRIILHRTKASLYDSYYPDQTFDTAKCDRWMISNLNIQVAPESLSSSSLAKELKTINSTPRFLSQPLRIHDYFCENGDNINTNNSSTSTKTLTIPTNWIPVKLFSSSPSPSSDNLMHKNKNKNNNKFVEFKGFVSVPSDEFIASSVATLRDVCGLNNNKLKAKKENDENEENILSSSSSSLVNILIESYGNVCIETVVDCLKEQSNKNSSSIKLATEHCNTNILQHPWYRRFMPLLHNNDEINPETNRYVVDEIVTVSEFVENETAISKKKSDDEEKPASEVADDDDDDDDELQQESATVDLDEYLSFVASKKTITGYPFGYDSNNTNKINNNNNNNNNQIDKSCPILKFIIHDEATFDEVCEEIAEQLSVNDHQDKKVSPKNIRLWGDLANFVYAISSSSSLMTDSSSQSSSPAASFDDDASFPSACASPQQQEQQQSSTSTSSAALLLAKRHHHRRSDRPFRSDQDGININRVIGEEKGEKKQGSLFYEVLDHSTTLEECEKTIDVSCRYSTMIGTPPPTSSSSTATGRGNKTSDPWLFTKSLPIETTLIELAEMMNKELEFASSSSSPSTSLDHCYAFVDIQQNIIEDYQLILPEAAVKKRGVKPAVVSGHENSRARPIANEMTILDFFHPAFYTASWSVWKSRNKSNNNKKKKNDNNKKNDDTPSTTSDKKFKVKTFEGQRYTYFGSSKFELRPFPEVEDQDAVINIVSTDTKNSSNNNKKQKSSSSSSSNAKQHQKEKEAKEKEPKEIEQVYAVAFGEYYPNGYPWVSATANPRNKAPGFITLPKSADVDTAYMKIQELWGVRDEDFQPDPRKHELMLLTHTIFHFPNWNTKMCDYFFYNNSEYVRPKVLLVNHRNEKSSSEMSSAAVKKKMKMMKKQEREQKEDN